MDENTKNQEVTEVLESTVETVAETEKSHKGLKKAGEIVLISSLAIAGYKGAQILIEKIKELKEKKNGTTTVSEDEISSVSEND